jgi:hypothetical protein
LLEIQFDEFFGLLFYKLNRGADVRDGQAGWQRH